MDIDLESKGGMEMQDLKKLKINADGIDNRAKYIQACATIAISERLDGILTALMNFNKPTGANIPLARVWDNEEDDIFNTWTNA